MAELIRTVIIDDENKSVLSLKKLLETYCSRVSLVGTAGTVKDAVETIDSCQPDLVFLDVTMPDGDGFDVLENTRFRNFEVIFITASDRFAIKAFEFSAIHYLLKPINPDDLKKAVERFEQIKGFTSLDQKINIIRESLTNNHKKIILPLSEGLIIKDLDDIIRCEAEDNYTMFFFTNNEKILVSKSLNKFENILSDINFCRIHNKHLVNLKYITKYVKGKSGYVILRDGSSALVSESRRDEFLARLKEFARSV